MARFSVIDDERGLVLGLDLEGTFEKGVVYEAFKVLDEIVLRPIGKYNLPDKGYPSKNSTIYDIAYSGEHIKIKL